MTYERIPIVDAARRCGIDINPKTLSRAEVEATCPFCGERPGKYHLGMNTERDVFKCVLCGEKGNSVSLYARLQSVSYGEAARELLDKCKVYPMPIRNSFEEKPMRSIEDRHEVFSAMLRHLALSDRHLQNLLGRGLSEKRIRENGYRSLPESQQSRLTLARILSGFYDLDGIPGFFRNNWGEWTIAGKPGILVPFRDKDFRIQGLQIRLDDGSNPKRKYRWLSSTDMKDGAKSGSWIHVTGNTKAETAFITEGALKGDVASYLDEDALFICVAGINAIGGLKEVIKTLGVRELVIAVDMDKVTNWRVRNGFENIAGVAKTVPGVKIRTANWNPSFKGIDDYYYIRQRGQVMNFQENAISAYLQELWRREYPNQDAGFIRACEWRERTARLSELEVDPPQGHMDSGKVGKYLELLKAGAEFPPIVCVNGSVIDGFHRCRAYEQAGIEQVRVYENVPWIAAA